MATGRTEVTFTLTGEEVEALKKGLSALTRNTGAAEARHQRAVLQRLKNAYVGNASPPTRPTQNEARSF